MILRKQIFFMFTVLGMFITSHSCAQKKDKDKPEPSSEMTGHFEKKYPEARDLKWKKDDTGYLEANFTLDGKKYRADYLKDGSWDETEKDIDYDDLPEAVRKTVENEGFDEKDVVEAEWVENSAKGIFYDVEVKKGKEKMDIEITADGTIMGRTGNLKDED